MTVRTLTDAAGRVWQLWAVVPGRARTVGLDTGRMPNVWGGAASATLAQAASTGDDGGWLVFMHETERRRLAPIPPEWEDLDEVQLRRLLLSAAGTGGPSPNVMLR